MNEEIWKDVKDYEGNYQVSNFGNVRSLPRLRISKGGSLASVQGKRMKQRTSKMGYQIVHLRNNTTNSYPSVHRLVAIAFIPNKENKTTVNHKDGNKSNNCVLNLEWATSAEQMRHAVELNLLKETGSPKFSKKFKQEIHDYYHSNDISIRELSLVFKISERTAGRIVKEVKPRSTTRKLKDGTCIVENILTQEQVEEIKKLRASGWTYAKLAEKFNRGLSQMHRVVNGLSRNTTIE